MFYVQSLTAIEYQTAQTVKIPLSGAIITTGTSLKWRQVSHSGANFDEWALDHVTISGKKAQVKSLVIFSEDFDRSPQFPYEKADSFLKCNV